MQQRLRPSFKKHHHFGIDTTQDAGAILREATHFLHSLEDLRREIIVRDEAFKVAKQSRDKENMEHYQKLASTLSQKCLHYGRELCESPIPHWVNGNLPKEKIDIAHHAYDVIRNKLCASLNVFDSDLLPNARTLIKLAEEQQAQAQI